MRNPIPILGALGIGAGIMYLFDPDKGKRRRAMMRDRANHLANVANQEFGKRSRDWQNRAQGVLAETQRLFKRETVSDEKLVAQIRAELGRVVSHPHAIKTEVTEGRVKLSGPILADEVQPLLNRISRLCGVKCVKEIENNLELHTIDENIPALQNGKIKQAENFEFRHAGWSPAVRILAATAGGGLAFYGAKRRDVVGSLLGAAGIGLATRGFSNKPFESYVGETGFHIHKTIKIKAPLEKVFAVCARPENFPQFMSHVREVEPLGDHKFKWTVDGVANLPVVWETQVTDFEPNKFIRWQSAENASIEQTGEMFFETTADGATRLTVEMQYRPPAGIVGHAIAEFFRRDPKSEMNDDLLRMKTFLEKRIVPRDAAANRRKDMKVAEIMTKNPVFAVLNTSLHDVAQMMLDNDCGCIPVTETAENKKPLGMITDRDITIRTVAHNKNPLNMIAGEVMTDNVISVTPDTNIEDCVAAMERNQIRRIAVVDDAGSLCGMVAQADIARTAPLYETAELVKDVSAHAGA